MPGSAGQIIDEHIYGQRVASDSMTRLTKAESFNSAWGALGAWSIAFGGLAATVWLVLIGVPAAAVGTLIPAVLAGAAQVVSAYRSGRS